MTNTNIVVWSPFTCGCQMAKKVSDEEGAQPEFLLCVNVCDDHAHMATPKLSRRADHKLKSSHVLSLIEDAKKRNHESAVARLDEPHIKRSPRLTRMQKANIELVERLNRDMEEEWKELIEPSYAYDSHVHDTVVDETSKRDKAHEHTLNHAVENKLTHLFAYDPNGVPMLTAPVQLEWEGKAPGRTLHFRVTGLTEEHRDKIEKKISDHRVKIKHGQ